MKTLILKATLFMSCLILIFLCTFSFGCIKDKNENEDENKNKYVEGEFLVGIVAAYKETFLNEEFTFDDFGGEYVESIQYNCWYYTLDPESGWITVHLKDEYKDKLDEVMQEVSEKDFVEYVEKNWYIYMC